MPSNFPNHIIHLSPYEQEGQIALNYAYINRLCRHMDYTEVILHVRETPNEILMMDLEEGTGQCGNIGDTNGSK